MTSRKEEEMDERVEMARLRVEVLKDMLRMDRRFSRYELVSTFDLGHVDNEGEATAMALCIQAVLDSDAVFMDRCWETSRGCRLEHAAAEIYGKRVYYLERVES